LKIVKKSAYLQRMGLLYTLLGLPPLLVSLLVCGLNPLVALIPLLLASFLLAKGARYFQGEWGEGSVSRFLSRILDDRYTLIRNLQIAKSQPDLDAVLVGPSGVLVMEIKNYSPKYSYRCEGSDWFWRKPGKRYRRKEESPTKQAIINTSYLKTYLSHHGIRDIPIETVVVITNPKAKFYVKKPHRPIFHPKELGEHIQSLAEEPLDDTICDSIVNLLKHV